MRPLLLASLLATAGGCATVHDGPATTESRQAQRDTLRHMATAAPPPQYTPNLDPYRDGMGPAQPPGPPHAANAENRGRR